jgi:osmotically-inducible protein OsmY
MANDNVIVDEIRAALERDPRLPHPAEVAVSKRAGTVTLRGSLASFRQRKAAAQIAKAVPGVAMSRMSSGSTQGITSTTIRSAAPRFKP